jgi:hypothetical protein
VTCFTTNILAIYFGEIFPTGKNCKFQVIFKFSQRILTFLEWGGGGRRGGEAVKHLNQMDRIIKEEEKLPWLRGDAPIEKAWAF